MTAVDGPVTRNYVLYLQARVVQAEAGLFEMEQKYEAAKGRFDEASANRGITPEQDMVSYQKDKQLHPELSFWYSKVEHYQRELAAYGAALAGIAAARRLLARQDAKR